MNPYLPNHPFYVNVDTSNGRFPDFESIKASGFLYEGAEIIVESDIVDAGTTAWAFGVNIHSDSRVKHTVTCGMLSMGFSPGVGTPLTGAIVFTDLHWVGFNMFSPPPFMFRTVYSARNIIDFTAPSTGTPLGSGGADVTIEDNVYRSLSDIGYAIMIAFIAQTGVSTHYIVRNNTFITALTGDGSNTIGVITWDGDADPSSTIEIYNNIMVSAEADAASLAPFYIPEATFGLDGIVIENNITYNGPITFSTDVVPESNQININPYFHDAMSLDYRVGRQSSVSTLGYASLRTGNGMYPAGLWGFMVSASGSNTYPYDTVETAATNFLTIKNTAGQDDTVDVVAGSPINYRAIGEGQPWFSAVEIKSWSGNNGIQPVIALGKDPSGSFNGGCLAFTSTIHGDHQGFKMKGLRFIADANCPTVPSACSLNVTVSGQASDGVDIEDNVFDFSAITATSGCSFGPMWFINQCVLRGNGVTIKNNIVVAPTLATPVPDLVIGAIDVDADVPGTFTFENNTCYGGKGGPPVIALASVGSTLGIPLHIRHNIFELTSGDTGVFHAINVSGLHLTPDSVVADNVFSGSPHILLNNATQPDNTVVNGAIWLRDFVNDASGIQPNDPLAGNPHSPYHTWGWQGWVKPAVPGTQFLLKYTTQHKLRTVLDMIGGMSMADRVYFTNSAGVQGLTVGMCVKVTGAHDFALITSVDDCRSAAMVIATSTENAGLGVMGNVIATRSTHARMLVDSDFCSEYGMTPLEPVVICYSGADAGKIATLDNVLSGDYYVIGQCQNHVVTPADDRYEVQLINTYKVTKA